ncbi:hypothetical protein Hanom_Chr09g00819491 [Helianthus anomalus]
MENTVPEVVWHKRHKTTPTPCGLIEYSYKLITKIPQMSYMYHGNTIHMF